MDTESTTPPDPTPALPSPSMQHKQQYMHHSHGNNRTHNIGYYDNLTNRPRTTTGLLTQQTHRPSNKSERNLIILQVNINGLRKKFEELKLLIHDTHADIITIQEINIRHDYRLQQNRRTFTNYKKADWTQLQKTQSPLSLRPTYTLPTEFSQTSY